jgi:hypothetical protein
MKTIQTFRITLFIAANALLAGASSCVDDIFVEGNGISKTEIRGASGFSQVSSSGDFNVTIVPGNDYEVEVTAESNLLSYVETDVVGNTLKIRTRGMYSLRDNRPIEIFVTTPELSGLSLSGSGMIKTGTFMSSENNFHIAISGSGDIDTEISADQISANISGSGTLFLQGDAYDTEFVISGSGKIKAYDLIQDNCIATTSGSGDMFINASETIDAKISGSGRIFYINYPVIHSSISGSGKIVDKN